jgi:hypothetical protein
LNISPPHLVHLRHSAPLGRRLRWDIATLLVDFLPNSNRSIVQSSASSNQDPGASLNSSPGERGSPPEQAIAVLVEVWGAIRQGALLSEGGAGIVVPFGSPVLGCDEPTDGASDEGEIQAFREEKGELVYDIEH